MQTASHLKRPWYWGHRTHPRTGDRATIKCAIRPTVPVRLPLVVHMGFSLSDFFLQANVFEEQASSCGLCLYVSPVPSKENLIILVQKSMGYFEVVRADFMRFVKLFSFIMHFCLERRYGKPCFDS